jgi:hypothetical protein
MESGFLHKQRHTTYLLLLYFSELQMLASNELRQFDILVDNATWKGSQHYTPKYLSAELVKRVVQGSSQHTVSLVARTDATLPPILNAFEIYSVLPMTELATNDADGICFNSSSNVISPLAYISIMLYAEELTHFDHKQIG